MTPGNRGNARRTGLLSVALDGTIVVEAAMNLDDVLDLDSGR